MTVLVVDDNLFNLELFTDLLEMSGHTVIGVGTGEEGIVKAAESQPDLILMDVSLPGLDGFEATRRIKAQASTAGIPVVALTAHRSQEHQQAAAAAGCAGLITKPIDADTFADQIAAYVKG